MITVLTANAVAALLLAVLVVVGVWQRRWRSEEQRALGVLLAAFLVLAVARLWDNADADPARVPERVLVAAWLVVCVAAGFLIVQAVRRVRHS